MSLTYDGITYAGASPSGLIAVSSALPALCIVAVALRFNVRRTQKSRFSMDDWIMLGALILVIAMGVVAILGEQIPKLCHLLLIYLIYKKALNIVSGVIPS